MGIIFWFHKPAHELAIDIVELKPKRWYDVSAFLHFLVALLRCCLCQLNLPAGEREDIALPSRLSVIASETSSGGTERRIRQPERGSPLAARRKAATVRLSKSSLPKSSPGNVDAAKAAPSKSAQSKAAQSKAPQATRRNSKATGAATINSTTRGKQGKGKVRTHDAVLLPRRAALSRHHNIKIQSNIATLQRKPI